MIETLISSAARDILSNTRIEGTIVYLPVGQLERKLYEEVNEVLARLGGKWKGGKVKGHVFDNNPVSDLHVVIQTGLMPPKNPNAFFETPPEIIEQMLERMTLSFKRDIQSGMHFLEPSAGKGAIILALRKWLEKCRYGSDVILHTCEIQPVFTRYLQSEGFEVVAQDFLAFTPEWKYEVILMNPPFSVEDDKKAYITHILHAWDILAPGGVLVAIASPGFTFTAGVKKLKDFLTLVEEVGQWEKLPEDSFKISGTSSNTVIITMVKPDELTLATEKAQSTQFPIEVPVFGSQRWIDRARIKTRR